MTFEQWSIFAAFWFVATLPIGPNSANCMVATVNHGLRAGLWSVAGVNIAAVTHIAATSIGLSAILLASGQAFMILKWLGVAYLAWLGIGLLRGRGTSLDLRHGAPPASPARHIRRAFFVSMGNPKAILAYLALFPQFIDPATPLVPQLAALVPTALVIISAVYAAYCVMARAVTRWLSGPRHRRLFNGTIGLFYLAAAAGLAGLQPSRP